MNAKKLLALLITLAGFALIVGGFMMFGASLETRVLVLHTIMACLLYARAVTWMFLPQQGGAHCDDRHIASWGLSAVIAPLFVCLVVGWMIYSLWQMPPFKYQLMGHLLIVFAYLLSLYVHMVQGETVQRVSHKEAQVLERKVQLQRDFAQLLERAKTVAPTATLLHEHLSQMLEECRFLSPSSHPQAIAYEQKMARLMEGIDAHLPFLDTQMQMVEEQFEALEQCFQARKRY